MVKLIVGKRYFDRTGFVWEVVAESAGDKTGFPFLAKCRMGMFGRENWYTPDGFWSKVPGSRCDVDLVRAV